MRVAAGFEARLPLRGVMVVLLLLLAAELLVACIPPSNNNDPDHETCFRS